MDDLCGRYSLRPVELCDKPLFDEAFQTLKEPLSDYTFANTFIWRTGLRLYWKFIHGHLCVFANGTGDLTMLLPPIGEGDLSRALAECFEIMDDYNGKAAGREHSRIEYVSEELLARMPPRGFASAPMGFDYVYDTQKMIELAGGELKSKRQAKAKFAREHRVETSPLTPADVSACLALLSRWQAYGDAHGREGDPLAEQARALRARDTLATREALEAMEPLGLTGMVLWADGRPVGFTMGEPLGGVQASILVEKTDLTYYGAAQYIFSEFCRAYWSAYPEVNAGDDWGLPSLRRTKESYRPKRLLPKYVVTAPARMAAVVRALPGPASALASGAAPGPEAAPAKDEPPRGEESGGAPCEIERAGRSDLDALCRLESLAFGELAISRRQIGRLLRSPRAIAWVARSKEEVIGWIVVLVRRHPRYESARIYSLAVAPGWRGRGVGSRLVDRALKELEKLGIARCFLEVAKENAAARRLYERFGFVTLEVLPDYYGRNRDAERMLRVACPAGAPAAQAR